MSLTQPSYYINIYLEIYNLQSISALGNLWSDNGWGAGVCFQGSSDEGAEGKAEDKARADTPKPRWAMCDIPKALPLP